MALIIICKLIGSEMIPPLLPLIQDKLLHPKYISLSLSLPLSLSFSLPLSLSFSLSLPLSLSPHTHTHTHTHTHFMAMYVYVYNHPHSDLGPNEPSVETIYVLPSSKLGTLYSNSCTSIHTCTYHDTFTVHVSLIRW